MSDETKIPEEGESADKRVIISMTPKMWRESKIVAMDAGISHTEYVRRAVAEKMERDRAAEVLRLRAEVARIKTIIADCDGPKEVNKNGL